MICEFSGLDEAYTIPEPKLVKVTKDGVFVFTGDDIPPPVVEEVAA